MSRFIPYIGGKRNLVKTILPLISPHRLYCEPFGGSATVLLAKPPSFCEIFNDVSGELITLFRVVKHHPEEFIREIRLTLRSREEFNRLQQAPPAILTDIQRAARYYYLIKAAYSGKPPEAGSHFAGKQGGASHPLTVYRVEPTLWDVHYRLSAVTIEHLSYGDCIGRYDGPEAFFYLDPPYYGHEKDYGPGIFSREDFADLAALLVPGRLQGKFLLSLNDRTEVRKLFAAFRMLEVTTTYQAGTRHGRACPAQELLIANYEIPILRETPARLH